MSDDDDDIPGSFFSQGFDHDDEDKASSEASRSSDDSDGAEDDADQIEQDMLASIFGHSAKDEDKDVEEDLDRKPSSAREKAAEHHASDEEELDRKSSATDVGLAAADLKPDDSPEESSPIYNTSSTKAMSLPPDVREAGRKARLRLKEEKSKRKEIVRIHDKAEELLAEKMCTSAVGGTKRTKTGGIASTAALSSAVAAGKKRRRVIKARSPAALDDQEDNGGVRIDSWMPDASSVSEEGRSNLVRVHGIPFGCKPEELRRFFAGLSPSRVLVLIPYDRRIDGWDCSDIGMGATSASVNRGETRKRTRGPTASTASTPRGPFVKRYSPVFRIFVQFESAPSAQLALKRSGESIFTTNAALLEESDDSDSFSNRADEAGKAKEKEKAKNKVGAAVFVSPVSKVQASFLKKGQVAIDGVKGEPLHVTLEAVLEQLPRFVKRTLWALAWINLRISQPRNPDSDDDKDCDDTDARKVADAFAILEKRMATSFPECPDTYRSLAIAYNSLCDLYDSIEGKAQLEMAVLKHDPNLLEDPMCRLTDAALEMIANEAGRIDLVLRHARENIVVEDVK